MTIWTRMALFTAIALLPVKMDDIHDYFVGHTTSNAVAVSRQSPVIHQIASIQGQ